MDNSFFDEAMDPSMWAGSNSDMDMEDLINGMDPQSIQTMFDQTDFSQDMPAMLGDVNTRTPSPQNFPIDVEMSADHIMQTSQTTAMPGNFNDVQTVPGNFNDREPIPAFDNIGPTQGPFDGMQPRTSNFHPELGHYNTVAPYTARALYNPQIGWYLPIVPAQPVSAPVPTFDMSMDPMSPTSTFAPRPTIPSGPLHAPAPASKVPRYPRLDDFFPELTPVDNAAGPSVPRFPSGKAPTGKCDIFKACKCRPEGPHVKRPLNAWMQFRRAKGDEVAFKIKSKSNMDIVKACAELWRALPRDEKEPYHRMAKAEEAEHKRLNPDYKYQPHSKFGDETCTCGAFQLNLANLAGMEMPKQSTKKPTQSTKKPAPVQPDCRVRKRGPKRKGNGPDSWAKSKAKQAEDDSDESDADDSMDYAP